MSNLRPAKIEILLAKGEEEYSDTASTVFLAQEKKYIGLRLQISSAIAAKKWQQALKLCRAYTEKFPSHSFGYVRQAEILVQIGKRLQARRTLEDSLRRFPSCSETVDRLYELSLQAGSLGEAKQLAARLIDLIPDSATGYMRSARVYFLDGALAAAERMLDIAHQKGATMEQAKRLRRSATAARGLSIASAEIKTALKEKPFKDRFIKREDLQTFLAERLQHTEGFFAGRMGRIEGRIVDHITLGKSLNPDLYEQGELNAGITPRDSETFGKFSRIYLDASKNMDLQGVSGFENELRLLQVLDCPHLTQNGWYNPLDLMTRRDHDRETFLPWTLSLQGQRVLVIHTFEASIRKQYKNRTKINTIKDILPDFELLTYKPAQTSASHNIGINWVDEYHRMRGEIADLDFDIALVGCGAYSIPIASDIRLRNKKALVLGGAVQTLFGIIGRRWEDQYKSAGILGDGWIRPSTSETPSLADKVERACYW